VIGAGGVVLGVVDRDGEAGGRVAAGVAGGAALTVVLPQGCLSHRAVATDASAGAVVAGCGGVGHECCRPGAVLSEGDEQWALRCR
jgi:hypothetical protein